MCFRPPAAQKPQKCPECGTMNPGTPKSCRKCQGDLNQDLQEPKDSKPKTTEEK